MPIAIPKCDKCEEEMILKEKGQDKFWGCKNWQRCGGKTKPYEGVDKPKPENETLARMELKLDWIIDNLKTPEQKPF